MAVKTHAKGVDGRLPSDGGQRCPAALQEGEGVHVGKVPAVPLASEDDHLPAVHHGGMALSGRGQALASTGGKQGWVKIDF